MPVTIINQCPRCDSEAIESDQNFCTNCANDLRPYQVTLPCCGKKLLITHDGWNFCPFCGAKDPIGLAEV